MKHDKGGRYYNECPRCRGTPRLFRTSIIATGTEKPDDPLPEYREECECDCGHAWTQTRDGVYGITIED